MRQTGVRAEERRAPTTNVCVLHVEGPGSRRARECSGA